MALTIKEGVRKWGPEYLTICGLVKYFPTMNYNSHVFFVNGTSTIGDDGVNTGGQVPDEPFLTITKALSECTDGANDYIFILDYPSTAPAETWPIAITKQRVHIIGVQNGLIPRFKIVCPVGQDTPAITFGISGTTYGAYCELANIMVGNGATASSRGIIEMHQGGLWGNHIHHCHFGAKFRSNTTGAHGIVIGSTLGGYPGGEMLYGLIEDCTFGVGLTATGILVPLGNGTGPNAVVGTIIRNNRFNVNTGDKGINVLDTAANFYNGGIYDNKFIVVDEAAAAINFAAGANGVVQGNRAFTLDDVTPLTAEVFKTGADGFSFGVNYVSGTAKTAENDYISE